MFDVFLLQFHQYDYQQSHVVGRLKKNKKCPINLIEADLVNGFGLIDNGRKLTAKLSSFSFQNPLSVDSFETAQLNVYPNPANDVWNVSSSATIANVAVFDILGKQVLSIAPNSNEATLDASSLRTGVYFARLDGVNGSKTIKLVKE